MKRLYLLPLLALALAACGAHTMLVADVDVLSFMDSAQLEGDLNVPGGTIAVYVPDADGDPLSADGGQLVNQLPLLDALHSFAVQVTVEVKNNGSGVLQIDADFRLAPESDSSNIYDGANGDVSLISDSLQLNPGEQRTLTLEKELAQGDPELSLITNSGFRVGMQIKVTGSGTVHYKITGLRLQLKQRPFDLIPN